MKWASLTLTGMAFLLLAASPPESGGRSNLLRWVAPQDADYAGTLIRYSLVSFPHTPGDGLPIPNGRDGRFPSDPGSPLSYLHDGLLPGETYYYSVFAYDDAGNYSIPAMESVVPGAPPDPGYLRAFVGRPNPFNGRVEVSWEIRAPQRVDLVVYDVSGQEVRRLGGGLFPAGRHTLAWDGRSSRGIPLPSGVYFLRVSSEHAAQVGKAVLLR